MIEVAKRLVDVEEYHKMAEVGILKPTDKVELINGEIIEMSPVGSKHASIVKRLTRILNELLKGKATLGTQDPVRLDSDNEPEPDISILKYRMDDYSELHPGPEDVMVLIEVSDTSYNYDKEIKINLYAQNMISESWIVDLKKERIEMYSESDGEEYLKKVVKSTGDSINILDKELNFSDIFY